MKKIRRPKPILHIKIYDPIICTPLSKSLLQKPEDILGDKRIKREIGGCVPFDGQNE